MPDKTKTPATRKAVSRWELLPVACLFLIGAFATWQGASYSIGSPVRMGPGFFPVGLGVLLMAFSLLLLPEVTRQHSIAPEFRLRPFAAILAGLLAFAFLVDRAGLVPAIFAVVVIGSFGDRTMRPRRAIASAIVLCAIGYLVFIKGFRLPLHPFWW